MSEKKVRVILPFFFALFSEIEDGSTVREILWMRRLAGRIRREERRSNPRGYVYFICIFSELPSAGQRLPSPPTRLLPEVPQPVEQSESHAP